MENSSWTRLIVRWVSKMCLIVDNNVRHEVFGETPTPAGSLFADSVNNKHHRLALGGRLSRELGEYQRFKLWYRRAIRYGFVREVDDRTVNDRTDQLLDDSECISNDHHVIALALVSGARLLFTNDYDLQSDFNNRAVVSGPRGRVYTTVVHDEVTDVHRHLLARRDLCAWSGCGK